MTSGEINDVLWPNVPFRLREDMILCGRRGSEAHGTYQPPTEPTSIDDRDLMGVCIPPLRYYFGLDRWEHAEAIKAPWDVVLYELRKFVGLLCQQNPNVLALLWLEPEDYLLITPMGQRLLDHRHLFRCRRAAYNAFMGYANGQLKRMTSFGEFRGYMGAKRKGLVEKYGYDTKNAAHLIRLLHMGEEYLRSGKLTVKRTWDVEDILRIKRGEVSLELVKQRAEVAFSNCRAAMDTSPLPQEIDHAAVRELLTSMLRDWFASSSTPPPCGAVGRA